MSGERASGTVAVVGGALDAAARGLAARPEVERVVYCDAGAEPLLAARAAHEAALPPGGGGPACDFVQCDEGSLLAGLSELNGGSSAGWLDAVVCPLSLHWANDVPGVMVQCREALRPDGLFLAALFGEGTLEEMRIACAVAEMEREGGASARTSPLVRVRDAGNLLGRAGLGLPVVDVDTLTVNYPDAFAAVDHLRRMGEQNANTRRRRALPRDTALAAGVAYQYLFGSSGGGGTGGGGEGGGEGLGRRCRAPLRWSTWVAGGPTSLSRNLRRGARAPCRSRTWTRSWVRGQGKKGHRSRAWDAFADDVHPFLKPFMTIF